MAKSARANGSSTQWRKIRKRILDRDEWICQYCGGIATTVDHVIPISKGGTDYADNLVAACTRCNYSKGGRFFYSAKTPLTPRDLIMPENASVSHVKQP